MHVVPVVLVTFSVGAPATVATEPPSDTLLIGNITTREADEDCEANRCVAFEVDSPGLARSASGRLVVSEPAVRHVGTIVLFSGGRGTSLLGEPPEQRPDVDISEFSQVLVDLVDAGFRLVRVQWDEGWSGLPADGEGLSALASRPATVTKWVAQNLADAGAPLCIGGGSGGAAQVSYMLTRYGLEVYVDLAVPWAGFWMGRVDLGCLDDDRRNDGLHYAEAARRFIDATYGFGAGEGGPCSTRDPDYLAPFQEASIAYRGDFHYPKTLVWHILGGDDQVGGLGQGLLYYAEMVRAHSPHVRLDVLPGMPHGLWREEVGAGKIREAFLRECRIR